MKHHTLFATFALVLTFAASAALAAGPPPEVQQAKQNAAKQAAATNAPPADVARAAGIPAGCPGTRGKRVVATSLTPEQQEALGRISKEFRDKAKPLQLELWAKHKELKALSGNKNVDKDDIKTLINEMQAVQTAIDNERSAFREKARRELGIAAPIGPNTGSAAAVRAAGKGRMAGYAKFGGPGPRGKGRGFSKNTAPCTPPVNCPVRSNDG